MFFYGQKSAVQKPVCVIRVTALAWAVLTAVKTCSYMDRNPQYKPEKKYPLWGSFMFAGCGMLASGVGVGIFTFYCYSGNMLTLIFGDTMPGAASIKLPCQQFLLRISWGKDSSRWPDDKRKTWFLITNWCSEWVLISVRGAGAQRKP